MAEMSRTSNVKKNGVAERHHAASLYSIAFNSRGRNGRDSGSISIYGHRLEDRGGERGFLLQLSSVPLSSAQLHLAAEHGAAAGERRQEAGVSLQ